MPGSVRLREQCRAERPHLGIGFDETDVGQRRERCAAAKGDGAGSGADIEQRPWCEARDRTYRVVR